MWRTTDLYDANETEVQVCKPLLQSYGKKKQFHGKIETVKVKDDNVLVKMALEMVPEGTVLVVDGEGSTNCALLGDNLANIARQRNLAGIIIYGCVRDCAELRNIELGILAIATMPKRSVKEGKGETNIPVSFGGVSWIPGNYVYVDEDGVIVCKTEIHQ
ncbi:regulator of ribonuclease activity A [Bacillus sp. 491mf]|uniref:ribonuclease E activity regulator RraA n=1 Tax=Bacillus TaxID=1386 RepID=UPI000557621C|nr:MULTISPECIES: ribonuclease E activity regulator RraA [unclassified Bacillus (in: firmicutes)]SFC77593.1 regulator of ribonuclease activity A [Bacillus sp. 491mf]